MKTTALFLLLASVCVAPVFAQRPAWVDNPGSYSNEYFVGVGVAKDKKEDKGREKAEKKAFAALQKLLKNKYSKKEVKQAMKSFRVESFYTDGKKNYHYALGLLPMESIDKEYAAQKKMDRARSAAMNAAAAMNAQFESNPDVLIMGVDEEIGDEAMEDDDDQ